MNTIEGLLFTAILDQEDKRSYTIYRNSHLGDYPVANAVENGVHIKPSIVDSVFFDKNSFREFGSIVSKCHTAIKLFGKSLKCIESCIMDNGINKGKQAVISGKSYVVIGFNEDISMFRIIDEFENIHSFDIDSAKWFDMPSIQ